MEQRKVKLSYFFEFNCFKREVFIEKVIAMPYVFIAYVNVCISIHTKVRERNWVEISLNFLLYV